MQFSVPQQWLISEANILKKEQILSQTKIKIWFPVDTINDHERTGYGLETQVYKVSNSKKNFFKKHFS